MLRRMNLKRTLFSALFLSLASSPLSADDFPYRGYFIGMRIPDLTKDDLERKCALHFAKIEGNGKWANYHVDFEKAKKGSLKYVKFTEGFSVYNDIAKLETSTTVYSKIYPQGEGRTEYKIMRTIGNDVISYYWYYRTDWVLAAVKKQDYKYGEIGSIMRCPFKEANIERFLSDEVTNLSIEEISYITRELSRYTPTAYWIVEQLKAD